MIRTDKGPIVIDEKIKVTFESVEIENLETGERTSLTAKPAALFLHLFENCNRPCFVSSITSLLWPLDDGGRDVSHVQDQLKRIRKALRESASSDYIKISTKSGGKDNTDQTSFTLEIKEETIRYLKGINETSFDRDLWNASQRDFFRKRNSRKFGVTTPIASLIPKGKEGIDRFDGRYQAEDGKVLRFDELVRLKKQSLSFIGQGGIGKTTSLYHILLDSFGDENTPAVYEERRQIPIYVELNQCPPNMQSWEHPSLHKTNFITRYIACVLEGHQMLDAVSLDTVTAIEKNFQIEQESSPRYLLLLDGFNEVSSEHDVRRRLCQEISSLAENTNVRIISTSRETKDLAYGDQVQNVQLLGIAEEDVLDYLSANYVPSKRIHDVKNNPQLLECLGIPLYLQLFCMDETSGRLPETKGEILYRFFHKGNNLYDLHTRENVSSSNPLGKYETLCAIDFILPFIGCRMEDGELFSASEKNLTGWIDACLKMLDAILETMDEVPFEGYRYSKHVLIDAIDSIRSQKNYPENVISCLYDYLGILRYFQQDSGAIAERRRYAFTHHQYRDYFSAVWDIRMLAFLQTINVYPEDCLFPISRYNDVLDAELNTAFWTYEKCDLIAQILGDYRYTPYFDENDGFWKLPDAADDESQLLPGVFDFCRKVGINYDFKYLLRNVIRTLILGRGELSGLDLSCLNLLGCNFHSIVCSRPTLDGPCLAADFHGSKLSQKDFSPESHDYNNLQFVYVGNYCYSVSMGGPLMCWDQKTGILYDKWNLSYHKRGGSKTYLPVWNIPAITLLELAYDKRSFVLSSVVSDLRYLSDSLWLFLLNSDGSPSKIIDLHEQGLTFSRQDILNISYTNTSDGIIIKFDDNTLLGIDIKDIKDEPPRQTVFYIESAIPENQIAPHIHMHSIHDETLTYFQIISSQTQEMPSQNNGFFCAIQLNVADGTSTLLYPPVSDNWSGSNISHSSVSSIKGNGVHFLYVHDEESLVYYCKSLNEYRIYDIKNNIETRILENCHLPENPRAIIQDSIIPNTLYIVFFTEYYELDISDVSFPILVACHSAKDILPSPLTNRFEMQLPSVANQKAILATDSYTYEWNMRNNRVIPKYATLGTDFLSFIHYDHATDTIVCAYTHSGIYITDGGKLNMVMSSPTKNYISGSNNYLKLEGGKELLCIRHDSSSYQFSKYDLRTGRTSLPIRQLQGIQEPIIGFAAYNDNMIFFADSHNFQEINLQTGQYKVLYESNGSDSISSINCRGNLIDIVSFTKTEAANTSHVFICHQFSYKPAEHSLEPIEFYICPNVENIHHTLIFTNKRDAEVKFSVNPLGKISVYGVCNGFFIPKNKKSQFSLKVQTYYFDKTPKDVKIISFYDEIYVSYKESRYLTHHYISTNGTHGVLSYDGKYAYVKAKDLTTENIATLECFSTEGFKTSFSVTNVRTFKDDGLLLSFAEKYPFIHNEKSNPKNIPIEINNFIYIAGCDFTECDIDEETREFIIKSGGITDEPAAERP